MRECCIGRGRRALTLAGLLALAAVALAPAELAADAVDLPRSESIWTLPEGVAIGRPPASSGTIEIRGAGDFVFDPSTIETLRPDIFDEGQFSVFDILVQLDEDGLIELEYTYDETAQTHIIQSLDGLDGWWYDAHYEGGSFDRTVVRIDCFPVKDAMSTVLFLEDPTRIEAIHSHYREEVERRGGNQQGVFVPLVVLRSAARTVEFADVAVTSHDVRPDVFKPGTITMLDVLLSLGDRGDLDRLGLEWRATEDDVEIVDGTYVVSIAAGDFAPQSTGKCVLTHQIGGAAIQQHLSPHTHTMSHIHLTGDLEVLVAPESVEWLWVCL